MLTVEFDDEMILDEMLVSYYSQRPTTVYHRFHKEYNGEMVMEYSRKLGLPKKVLNDITAYVRDNCSVLVAFKRSNVVCPELEKVYDYFNNRFPDRYTDVKTMTEFARNQLINDEDGKAKEGKITKKRKGYTVQRYKGLGEDYVHLQALRHEGGHSGE